MHGSFLGGVCVDFFLIWKELWNISMDLSSTKNKKLTQEANSLTYTYYIHNILCTPFPFSEDIVVLHIYRIKVWQLWSMVRGSILTELQSCIWNGMLNSDLG